MATAYCVTGCALGGVVGMVGGTVRAVQLVVSSPVPVERIIYRKQRFRKP